MDQPDLASALRRHRLLRSVSSVTVIAVYAVWFSLGLAWNWAFFVVYPALLGVAMLWVRPGLRVTSAHRVVAGMWLGAGALGALSHWNLLSPVTVWLSLARYVLIAVAITALLLPGVFLWPIYFETGAARRIWWQHTGGGLAMVETEPGPVRCRPRWWQRMGWGIALAAWFTILGVVLYLTPFPLSMTPVYPGARYRRVFAAEECKEIRDAAFSPDGHKVLVQVLNDIWLVPLPEGKGAKPIAKGALADQNPWLPSGKAFVLVRETGDDAGIWVSSEDGRYQRRLVAGGDLGEVVCAPDGSRVAFRQRGVGLVVMSLDGVSREVVVKRGYLPLWSPNGGRLLFQQWDKDGDRLLGSFWVAVPGGMSRELPIPWSLLPEVAWLPDDRVAISPCPQPPWEETLSPVVTVDIYSLSGSRVRRFQFGTLMGPPLAQVAASPDGRSLAVSASWPPLWSWPSRSLVLDVKTGRVRRLPAPGDAICADWSPDGHLLVVIEPRGPMGFSKDRERRPRVGIVSGL